MGELEQVFSGQLEFNIIPAEETAQRGAEIDKFGFTDAKHGLVIFGADGEPEVLMPGHSFGRDEIAVGIKQVVAPD